MINLPFFTNPIDLSHFIGIPQDPEKKKQKLLQLYEADAIALLDKGDIKAYNLVMEKIKELKGEKKEEENKETIN